MGQPRVTPAVSRRAAVSGRPGHSRLGKILATRGRGGAEVNTQPGRGHNVYLFPTRYACHHG